MGGQREKANAAADELGAELSARVAVYTCQMVEGWEMEVVGFKEEAKYFKRKAKALEEELGGKKLVVQALQNELQEKAVEIGKLQQSAQADKLRLEEMTKWPLGSKPQRTKTIMVITIFERMRMAMEEIESGYVRLVKADESRITLVKSFFEIVLLKLRDAQSTFILLAKQRTKAMLIVCIFERIGLALGNLQSHYTSSWELDDARIGVIQTIVDIIRMRLSDIQAKCGPLAKQSLETLLEPGALLESVERTRSASNDLVKPQRKWPPVKIEAVDQNYDANCKRSRV